MANLTPLATVPAFTDLLRERLADYWITSLEEYVSTARTGNQQFGSGLAALARVLGMAEDAALGLYQAAQQALPADVAFDVAADLAVETGAIFEGMPKPSASAFDIGLVELPAHYRLTASLPPARSQGRRSTCVAFTLAAMVQQISGETEALSPQFLYWACKERDEIPGDKGTRPDIAMEVLKECGVCREQQWSYNAEPNQDNPGQGPPPVGTIEDAQQRRIADIISISPDDITGIKALIATGKSVLIGLAISEHWRDSWQAQVLGRVRAPLPGEATFGGHALLAIGYQDDPAVPGNGYLIVRNSWGTTWGRENPDGAGLAHIPYQVIYDRNQAAFAITGMAPLLQAASAPSQAAAPVLSAAATAGSEITPEQIRAIYQEAQQIVATTLSSLIRLDQLMGQLASLAPATPKPNPPTPVAAGPLVLMSGRTGTSPELLAPNGILATIGEPLLKIDAQAASALARASAPAKKEDDPEFHLHKARVAYDENQHLGTVLGNENNIDEVGWAIVIHADEDAELLKALSPLIAKRCADQGFPLPQLEFRAGETCGEWLQRSTTNISAPLQSHIPVLIQRSGENATQWLARHGTSQGPVDPKRGVPFYLLLVGRPGPLHANDRVYIPFEFQYELDLFWGVGRLCFTNPQTGQHDLAAYRAYAEQVVACEQAAGPPQRKQIVYFGTQHKLDRSTELSATELVTPLAQGLPGQSGIAAALGFRQHVFLADQATHANLARILRGDVTSGPPALIFTASHGIGFPTDDPRLPGQQGALICQDWSGFGAPKREHWYAAEDLTSQTNVAGTIAVFFACYGAGCPQADQFVFTPGQQRPAIAPYPLVAQLPQRLLARGALAVLGHVDRAWTHSFRTSEVQAQTQRFESVLGRLMRGDRLGLATDQFNMVQGAIATRLADTLEKISFGYQMSDIELSTLWVARNDARNYALLGDPAVRLSFRLDE